MGIMGFPILQGGSKDIFPEIFSHAMIVEQWELYKYIIFQ